MTRLLEDLYREVPGVIEEISPHDQMYKAIPEYYFEAGQLALRNVRLAMLSAGLSEPASVLDLPCGHGRVLRTLKAAFPRAAVTACDINRDGVDFCAAALGAIPVYSAQHPRDVALEGPFDLIWVGSLLTHLDLDGTRAFLDLFESILAPTGGVLVFTTHGRMIADRVRARLEAFGMRRHEVEERFGAHPAQMAWGMQKEQIEEVLDGYDRTGFGYTDWFSDERRSELSMPVNYGISIANPSWTCAEIERRSALRLVMYKEGGWGHQQDWWSQDVVGCVGVG